MNQTATIERDKVRPSRRGNYRFQWTYHYTVVTPDGARYGQGAGLQTAREWAAKFSDRIVEDWPDGRTWGKGPRGGLRVE